MPPLRLVKTCDRCRHFKRRCDLLKPSCSRCVQASVRCSFDLTAAAAAAAAAAASSTTLSTASASASTFTSASTLGAVPASVSASLPIQNNLAINPSLEGLISPSVSTESPESLPNAPPVSAPDASVDPVPSDVDPSVPSERIVRKRKRNCLSCLRCHRLKVKCDKELPCGRCKSSGNGRECYYNYNKGPNGGQFACPTAPIPPPGQNAKSSTATWHITHKVRGASHWRELMTKVWPTLEALP